MKRILTSSVLTIVLLLSCVSFIACAPAHNFDSKWSRDETHHWKACKDADCTEISNKAEHEWDNGEVIVSATPTSKGEIKYTCKTCNYEKTEEVAEIKTTVTADGWVDALDLSDQKHMLFETTTDNGKTSKSYLKYTLDKLYQGITSYHEEIKDIIVREAFIVAEGDKCYNISGTITADGTMDYIKEASTLEVFESTKVAIFNYADEIKMESFTYDEASYSYRMSSAFKLHGYDVYDATIKFENGKVVSMEFYRTYGNGRELYNLMLFSYENIQIDVPKVE
jgi:hypothetical protein